MLKPIVDEKRNLAQRCADWVCEFCGSWNFVIWFSLGIAVWVVLNSLYVIHNWGKFDPYPYIALNLVLTVVSTMQGPLIMMSQNRQADRDRQAVHDIHEKLDIMLERNGTSSDLR